MTVTASQKIINELSGFEFEVAYQNTSNVVIKTNKGHYVSITLDKQGYYTLYRCSPDSFGGFDLMAGGCKVYRTMKSINKWIIKRHVDTSEEFEVVAPTALAPVVEESNELEAKNEVEAETQTETMQVSHENGQIIITSQSGDRLAVSTDDTGKLNVKFLGTDEVKEIATPTSITVSFTEAPIEQEIFESAKELDDAMEDILNAPDCDLKDGCYYKTDVTIEFDDGESWHGRINYEKDGHFDSRLVEYFQYYQQGYVAGSEKPDRLSQEEFESRVKFYSSRSIT